ncbi:MAG TPA: N,N-dimethylformamidase beta subunit family domain-containing protein, partial [Gaiella sp.]|nr:N,N-dimethylformamidase beta subunit family domain-containing protein [Gaiella sp.]
MRSGFTRRRLLRAAAAAGLVGALPAEALARDTKSPKALALSVRGSKLRFAGDRPMFVTIAPGVAGRDVATVRFGLDRRALVQLDAVLMGIGTGSVVWTRQATLRPGVHEIAWQPATDTPVGSYVMRLTLSKDGRRRVYGEKRPHTPERATAPVVHLLGVEAAFTRRSYLPTEPMDLLVRTDAPSFVLSFLRLGHGPYLSLRSDDLTGESMGAPVSVDWSGKRSAARRIRVQSGTWPSGLYAARLETPDGRVGFAPFVLRAPTPGPSRVAVVLPTNTWQAYNLHDADGDGWGDTWYAGGNPPVVLDRPYRARGVPPRFRRYDYPFLRWLEQTRRNPDFFTDDDLDALASGDDLRRLYDLVVFPGHTEYVSQHAYDVVERYRDLGGRLVFLSANNFFWKVEREGNAIRRIAQWRTLGRPESRLLGIQYRANDDGTRQGPYIVSDVDAAPWLFAGTGLASGSVIGEEVGGFGIEIDSVTPESPPGTTVLARIPDLFGPGVTAEMAYY